MFWSSSQLIKLALFEKLLDCRRRPSLKELLGVADPRITYWRLSIKLDVKESSPATLIFGTATKQ